MTEIYAMSQGHKYWEETLLLASECSWNAGAYLSQKMAKNEFNEWERVFCAVENGKVVGFCTLAEKDELPITYSFTPFIGFVFVDEQYRGKRISQLLIDNAASYARELGYQKIYIMSGEIGLYEKYGFMKLGDYETIHDTEEQLFVKSINDLLEFKEDYQMEKITQTAGRNQLGDFAPDFAHFNDDVLFGENWNNADIDLKTRCIITVVALMSSGITDASLTYHLENAKAHGVTKAEIATIVTHVGFYVGWPKAWAVFRLTKDVWSETEPELTEKDKYQNSILFPIGAPNDGFAQYFIGQSYLAPVSKEQVGIFNVTFEPGCRNNWHVHHADKGGGQILICVGGRGYYQEWGKEAVAMKPGDCLNIPAGVKHWHGAAPDSWFSHLTIEVPGENSSNEWLESVDAEQYGGLK